jgi:diguanylate cyclase (GGDEF)-like protein
MGRHDPLLLAGFAVALLVIFERTIRHGLLVAQDIENTYGVALLPALLILSVMFVFHQAANRREARAEAAAAANEAAVARARASELENLMLFGQSLARSLTIEALRETLLRHLPSLTGDAEAWVLLRQDNGWERLTDSARAQWPKNEIENVADELMKDAGTGPSRGDGRECQGHICFVMLVGNRAVGVVGIADPRANSAQAPSFGSRRTPGQESGDAVSLEVRRKIGAAAALLTVAIRNAQLFAEVRDNGMKDALTGCYNRAHGLEMIDAELARSKRSQGALSIMMFDVDYFKRINDQYGHPCGDAVLTAVGQRLRQVLRRSDVRCRYGGDEFLILLPETGNEGAARVAEWLRGEIEQIEVARSGHRVAVTISVGVCTTMGGELGADALIETADHALYQAKAAGRNCVRVATVAARPARQTVVHLPKRDAVAS